MARLLPLVGLIAAAACSDGAAITAPGGGVPVPAVSAIPCTASVRSGRLECGASAGGVASGARGDRILGGQRLNVLLPSTNVAYDSVTQRFGADVTVQNLLAQRMGSDGATVTGVKIFFSSGPSVTGGTGQVTVQNPDGYDLFTASGQPYFDYAGGLGPQAVSAPKHWVFSVPKTVQTFAFTLYVSTPVVPAIVFEMAPGGNRDIYRMGIDGNDVLKLSNSPMTDANPTVANGTVVFNSYRDGNSELYSVPLKGGTETRLTSTATWAETSPSLSPDGTKLAWVGGPNGGVTKIWTGTATATGAALAAVGSADATIENSPKWKDASTLAFVAAVTSSADIFSLAPGNAPVLLTGLSSSADVEPAWSPDGTKVAFASNRTGDTELYLLDVASGGVTRLTNRAGSDGAPTWLKDGRIVYTCVTGSAFKLCMLDPASPATVTVLATPYAADHAAGVLY